MKEQKGLNLLKRSQAGLTLIELLLVVGILSTLLGIAFISVSNINIVSYNTNTTSVLVSDLRKQQIKAMTGDTEGRGVPDNYGVKILPDRYVLFHGTMYNSLDSTNFSIPIESGRALTSTFSNNTILFASESGEIVGFVQNQNTVTLTSTSSGQTRTIRLNKYGAITSNN